MVSTPIEYRRFWSLGLASSPMQNSSLILASASPRRRELLERVGIEVAVVPADVDESVMDGEEAVPYATRVAASKANTIALREPDRWVLAADTVVEVSGAPLGKPSDVAEARQMLLELRGSVHRVTTAMCLRGRGTAVSSAVTTEVVMRNFADWELAQYLEASEWQGKAGAYAVQGMAAAFVLEVRGSITNVIGLPLSEVVCLLQEHGVTRADYRRGCSA